MMKTTHGNGEQMIANQDELALAPQEPNRATTAMELLSIALRDKAAIDVIERLAALQREERALQSEIDFNEAMNRVQEQIKRIAPDLDNSQTRSRYASYAAIDRKIRPIYSQEGLSLSFDTVDCPLAEHIRVVCYVALRGHVRRYQVDMPCDGKGAKGGDVMSKTHASGAAMQYGMRYLVKGIFNIAIGDEDTDGNLASNGELAEQLEWIQNASTPDELKKLYAAAYGMFESNPAALKVIIAARKARKEDRGW
jgi:ERF superfamily protein